MRTWIRAHRVMPCGNCSKPIPAGALVLEVGEAKLPRCKPCAESMFGEEPPDDLPAERPLQPTSAPRTPTFVTPKGWAADYKAKAAKA